MITIGKKSYGDLLISIIFFILMTMALVFVLPYVDVTKESEEVLLPLAGVFLFWLLSIGMMISTTTRKKNLIEYENSRFCLNYRRKTIKISIKDIERIHARRDTAKGFSYPFGKIMIYTEERIFKMPGVANVEEVENRMNRIYFDYQKQSENQNA